MLKRLSIGLLLLLILTGCIYHQSLSSSGDIANIIKRVDSASPEEIVKLYFWAINNHDVKTAMKCLSSRTAKNLGSQTNDPFRMIISKRLDKIRPGSKSVRDDYLSHGAGKYFKPHDVTVLEVTYTAKYVDDKITAERNGTHTWNYILIKETPNSGWKIDDMSFAMQ